MAQATTEFWGEQKQPGQRHSVRVEDERKGHSQYQSNLWQLFANIQRHGSIKEIHTGQVLETMTNITG